MKIEFEEACKNDINFEAIFYFPFYFPTVPFPLYFPANFIGNQLQHEGLNQDMAVTWKAELHLGTCEPCLLEHRSSQLNLFVRCWNKCKILSSCIDMALFVKYGYLLVLYAVNKYILVQEWNAPKPRHSRLLKSALQDQSVSGG